MLYLWHGSGGYEGDWTRDGRAAVILDNLLADKKAVPFLVVMPNNVPSAPAWGVSAPARQPEGPAAQSGRATYARLKQELQEDIIPYVAKHYRTIENRTSRAIAGLSAGGGTTMNVGMASLDTFAWVAEFSSGMFGGVGNSGHYDMEQISPEFYKDPAATNRKLKLFYMSCGNDDPRMPSQKKALEEFRSHDINVTFAGFPGMHQWKVWRHSLADLAPRLFR